MRSLWLTSTKLMEYAPSFDHFHLKWQTSSINNYITASRTIKNLVYTSRDIGLSVQDRHRSNVKINYLISRVTLYFDLIINIGD